jgi:hypothetical protein
MGGSPMGIRYDPSAGNYSNNVPGALGGPPMGGGGGKRLQPAPPPVNYQQPSPFGRKGGARAQPGPPGVWGGQPPSAPFGALDAYRQAAQQRMAGTYQPPMQNRRGFGFKGGAAPQPGLTPYRGVIPGRQVPPGPGDYQGQLAKTQNRYADALRNMR